MSSEPAECQPASVLLYGFGNPGRGDDGLGAALVQAVQAEGFARVAIECDCQLNVEDCLTISTADIVIFADASREEIGAFRFNACAAATRLEYTTHTMSPGQLVALCRKLYGTSPQAYLLEIRGYEWEMVEALSALAAANLEQALTFLRPLLQAPSRAIFRQAAGRRG